MKNRNIPCRIWTPDDVSEAEMERVYLIVSEHSLLNDEYRFNLKYALAKFFMERAAVDGKTLSIKNLAPDGNMASINLVFTRPEFRKRHQSITLFVEYIVMTKKDF